MPSQAIQGKSTRRRHAAEFKRDLIERCLQPGASVSGIALENGINANVLFRWRRQHLRSAALVQARGAARTVLLPVEVATTTATAAKQEAVSSCSPMPAGVIEIEIGAARVRLRGAVDEANVRSVLHTLRAIA
jgi:transposase